MHIVYMRDVANLHDQQSGIQFPPQATTPYCLACHGMVVSSIMFVGVGGCD